MKCLSMYDMVNGHAEKTCGAPFIKRNGGLPSLGTTLAMVYLSVGLNGTNLTCLYWSHMVSCPSQDSCMTTSIGSCEEMLADRAPYLRASSTLQVRRPLLPSIFATTGYTLC